MGAVISKDLIILHKNQNRMNISLLTSGHDPFDDRIFYHMARSLFAQSNNVEIVSSKLNLMEVVDGIRLNCFAGDNLSKKDKISQFVERLSVFTPEIIICSEPLTVLAAKQYSKKRPVKIRIVYDITEWYPSKKNLAPHKPVFRWVIFLKLFIFNIFASCLTDAFIFGEWYKSKPYRFLFPNKPFTFITYYPNLKYFSFNEPALKTGKLRLAYSGKISIEKGFGNFIRVLECLTEYHKSLKIEVKIVGWYESAGDKKKCDELTHSAKENISFSVFGRQPFIEFWELINDTDIFLDLRADTFENQHCLPIKLFYYAALGRPVIFSDLKAIRREVEIENFGFLVKPEKTDTIVQIISEYLKDRKLYHEHCRNARKLAESNYNWQKISPQFIGFIDSLSS